MVTLAARKITKRTRVSAFESGRCPKTGSRIRHKLRLDASWCGRRSITIAYIASQIFDCDGFSILARGWFELPLFYRFYSFIRKIVGQGPRQHGCHPHCPPPKSLYQGLWRELRCRAFALRWAAGESGNACRRAANPRQWDLSDFFVFAGTPRNP